MWSTGGAVNHGAGDPRCLNASPWSGSSSEIIPAAPAASEHRMRRVCFPDSSIPIPLRASVSPL